MLSNCSYRFRGVQELLSVPDQSTFVGMRDYTLILLTLDTGIRPSEALGLLPDNLNLMTGSIYIPAAKAK